MAKLSKYALWVGVALTGLLVWVLTGETGRFFGDSGYQGGTQQGAIERAQEAAARELRKQLPMKVDDVTTLQDVSSVGKTLIYEYKLFMSSGMVDKGEFRSTMRAQLVNNACQKEEMKSKIDGGAMYTYKFLGIDGSIIATIKISASDC